MRNNDERVESLHRLLHESFRRNGITFAAGIPCGAQKLIIRNITNDHEILHVPCNRESEAIGLAAGAFLASRTPIVYMQNSGLFGASNDIASLLIPYQLPIFMTVTWRGLPGEDAPQHLVTGSATTALLEAIGVSYRLLSQENAATVADNLFELMQRTRLPAVLLVPKGWYR